MVCASLDKPLVVGYFDPKPIFILSPRNVGQSCTLNRRRDDCSCLVTTWPTGSLCTCQLHYHCCQILICRTSLDIRSFQTVREVAPSTSLFMTGHNIRDWYISLAMRLDGKLLTELFLITPETKKKSWKPFL